MVTVSNLRSAAGDRSYLRGQEYFEDGAVHFMCCDGEQLTAEVHGTHVYHARITNNDGFLTGECRRLQMEQMNVAKLQKHDRT